MTEGAGNAKPAVPAGRIDLIPYLSLHLPEQYGHHLRFRTAEASLARPRLQRVDHPPLHSGMEGSGPHRTAARAIASTPELLVTHPGAEGAAKANFI